MSGVYLHIPFCASKCAYCDFASWANRKGDWAQYVRMLIDEIETSGGGSVETVFFGGGTPSLLQPELLVNILDAVRRTFDVHPDAEITLEANPGTLDAAKLEMYRKAGFNRISLGVQAADERLLRSIGRIHTWQEAEDAVRMAHEAGFENISLDLMYGLPEQSVQDVEDALDKALALPIRHISCYNLIVEEGTPLARGVEAGKLIIPDEDIQAQMQRAVCAKLEAAGFDRYEISNYALPGYECRHNINYWMRGNYYGFGCAAHSLVNGVRYANPDSLDDYLCGERRTYEERLTEEDVRIETVMLGTRTRWGADASLADEAEVKKMIRSGLARMEGNMLVMTAAGWEVHNAILARIL
ncbi:MAG: radical SAM family heme chaperone HemW [Clostridiales bacterium]|nr:radical SAM family heme chaperone HemW [Clostridiales bacterium]